ncbi:hypothetical protein [Desulfobacula phenolica]|uniref:Uncharacterized protein n=1 Tax=Desulfobacula phenolica TaxID=90732 RepID=A0A1H2KEZ9_9BACT|nr:hypothetical protein [Desulfobacula phenolica]SDU67297.1 hypothetical protein SAMN04487931_1391 [Desulfobacula phenolica]
MEKNDNDNFRIFATEYKKKHGKIFKFANLNLKSGIITTEKKSFFESPYYLISKPLFGDMGLLLEMEAKVSRHFSVYLYTIAIINYATGDLQKIGEVSYSSHLRAPFSKIKIIKIDKEYYLYIASLRKGLYRINVSRFLNQKNSAK